MMIFAYQKKCCHSNCLENQNITYRYPYITTLFLPCPIVKIPTYFNTVKHQKIFLKNVCFYSRVHTDKLTFNNLIYWSNEPVNIHLFEVNNRNTRLMALTLNSGKFYLVIYFASIQKFYSFQIYGLRYWKVVKQSYFTRYLFWKFLKVSQN